MDERFELNGVSFVWNQAKAQENPLKHEVTFERGNFSIIPCNLVAWMEPGESRVGLWGSRIPLRWIGATGDRMPPGGIRDC